MVHHAPAIAALAKNVGRQDHCGNRLPLDRAIEVFVEGDPGKLAAHLNGDIGQTKADLGRVRKNLPPAFHDRSPTAQDPPTGVAALDLAVLRPHRFHLLYVEIFEGAIKIIVRPGDGLLFGGHKANQ